MSSRKTELILLRWISRCTNKLNVMAVLYFLEGNCEALMKSEIKGDCVI